MLKILKGFYGDLDITDELNKFINNDKLITYASNSIFGDPNIGKVKKMIVDYEYNGIVKRKVVYEGFELRLPEINNIEPNKIILLTSCNRIKQVILALVVNSFIIKSNFYLIIADSSTPNISNNDGHVMHSIEPYNHITTKNYCSNIELFEKYIPTIKNIIDYHIIHCRPRMEKVEGDANLIALGLTQASFIRNSTHNNNFCLKLTGVSILNEDILTTLPEMLHGHDVLTYHRSGFNFGEKSTRVFGCRPEALNKTLIDSGWYAWVNKNAGDIEHRFADIINDSELRDNYANLDESVLMESGGCDDDEYRRRLIKIIEKNNIPKNIEIISEFLAGGIW